MSRTLKGFQPRQMGFCLLEPLRGTITEYRLSWGARLPPRPQALIYNAFGVSPVGQVWKY